ncbi:DUF554 family protein [Paenibacillus glucanolyticus]|uniref:DUF554 family protein n=1 Tax=Paenibacillus glucanolyticus TaxID=59843 RepID=UPI0037A7C870
MVSVLFYQPLYYFVGKDYSNVLADAVSGFITPELLTEISIVGGILILSSGLSILGIRHFKTMNLIPALLIPVVFITLKTMLGM